MEHQNLGVLNSTVAMISDQAYFDVLKTLILKANSKILASVFIVDVNGHNDSELKIYQILKYLQDAIWRGVEVKLLIGGSRENLLIAESAQIARDIAIQLGIACKWLTSGPTRGSHCKFIVADALVL